MAPEDAAPRNFAEDTVLGERLVAAGAISTDDLLRCLDEVERTRPARLADVLLRHGLVSETQLEAASRVPASERATRVPPAPAPVVRLLPPGAATPPSSAAQPEPPRPPSGRASVPPPGPPRPSSGRRAHPAAAAADGGLEAQVAAALTDPRRRIGRYVMLCELGRGGMARVLLAWDPSLRRRVAIKTILETFQRQGEEVERFAREARAAARLRHPGIVAVHEVGEHKGRPFLVMDYVEGRPLDAVIDAGELTPRRAAEIARDVALALEHAHREGVLHRDVKPQNVIVDAQGRPHLTDFGLARDLSAFSTDRSLTVTGQMLGTPHYVSPEQARGEHAKTGPASDVYSLGGVLYHALTRRPPFDGGTMLQLLNQVFEKDPVGPCEIDPHIHPDLETITLRCLDKEPRRRYQSARAVADELGRFLRGEAIEARPIRGPERLRRWAGRNRALSATIVAASVVVIGLLMAGAIFAAHSFGRIQRERDRFEDEKLRAQQAEADAQAAAEAASAARARAEAESRAKDGLLARALREKGGRLLTDGSFAEAAALFAASLRIEETHSGRNGLAQGLSRAGALRWSAGGAMPAIALAIDAAHERLLLGAPDGLVRIFDLERETPDGPLVRAIESGQLEGNDHAVLAIAFSSDGRRAATADQGGLVAVWDVESRAPVARLSGHIGAVNAVAWRGGQVVTAGEDGTLRQWDIDAMAPMGEPLTGHEGEVFAIAYAPATDRLVTAGEDGTIRQWDLAERRCARTLRGHEGPVLSLAFDPSGRFLASGGADTTVRVWDLAGGEAVDVLSGHREPVRAVAFDGDGRRLVAGADDGALMSWPVGERGDAGEARALRGASGAPIESVLFGPGGRWLLTGCGRDGVRAWDADTGRELGARAGHRSPIWAVAWSDDGARIASGGADGTVRLWSAEDGEPLGVLRGHEDEVNAVCWLGADGARLASASDDGTIRVWDVIGQRELAALSGHRAPVLALASDARGTQLLSGDIDGRVRLWHVPSGQSLIEIPAHRFPVLAVALSPDGTEIATGAVESVRFWSAKDGAPRGSMPHAGVVVRYLPDGSYVHVAEPDGERVVWDARRRVEVHPYLGTVITHTEDELAGAMPAPIEGRGRFPQPAPIGPPEPGDPGLPGVSIDLDRECRVVALADMDDYNIIASLNEDPIAIIMIADGGTGAIALGPDARRVAVGGRGGSLQVWDVGGVGWRSFDMTQEGTAGAVALGPAGAWLATGGGEGRVRLWETASRGRAVEVGRAEGIITSMVFAPDGRRIAVAASEEPLGPGMVAQSRTRVTVWDVSAAGPPVLSFDEHAGRVRALDWSPDGELVASAGDDLAVRVWRAADATLVRAVDGHRGSVNAVAWSPDGQTLATGSEDGTVRLIARGEWTPRHVLEGHRSAVRGLAWSRDGARIATAGADRTVRLWDPKTGAEVRRLTSTRPVESVAFGPGSLLLYFEHDGWFRMHDLEGRLGRAALQTWRRDGPPDRFQSRIEVGPRGERVAVVRQGAPAIVFWDLRELGVLDDPAELAERVYRRTTFRVEGLEAVPLRHRIELR